MSSAVQDLLNILDLEPLEVNLFRGRSPQVGWQRVFGGQVIGQALVAAVRTVEGPAAAFPARLLPAAGRSQSTDHLRRRSHARRQELYHAARHRPPAWTSDFLNAGVVPHRRTRSRPSGQNAGRAAAGKTSERRRYARETAADDAGSGPALLRARAPDRAAAGRIRALSRQENSRRTIQHLDSHHRQVARLSRPSINACWPTPPI